MAIVTEDCGEKRENKRVLKAGKCNLKLAYFEFNYKFA